MPKRRAPKRTAARKGYALPKRLGVKKRLGAKKRRRYARKLLAVRKITSWVRDGRHGADLRDSINEELQQQGPLTRSTLLGIGGRFFLRKVGRALGDFLGLDDDDDGA